MARVKRRFDPLPSFKRIDKDTNSRRRKLSETPLSLHLTAMRRADEFTGVAMSYELTAIKDTHQGLVFTF